MKISIIGAGIGGLTTAVFLQKMGMSVKVFEQSKEIKAVGAGLVLAHNAMQAFERFGLSRPLLRLGNVLTSANIRTEQLTNISTLDYEVFDDKYGTNCIAIERSKLQQLLVEQLEPNTIILNKKIEQVFGRDRLSLVFSDGEISHCNALIAADGIKSVIRDKVFEEKALRKTDQICWRGVSDIDLPSKFDKQLNELWGIGSRFGFVELSNKKVYWYGLHHKNEKLVKEHLKDYFSNYTPVVKKIISSTKFENIFKSEIMDLKVLPCWYLNNVCLLGDAAHATTPNLGQGACQAIEDAYVLSHCLGNYSLEKAFKIYQSLRKNKADRVTLISRNMGLISQLKNPVLSRFRDSIFRSVPNRLNVYQFEKIFNLTEVPSKKGKHNKRFKPDSQR